MTFHRGTVLQVPTVNQPGLLFVDGQQLPFELAHLWQSPMAPAINQTVDIERGADGAHFRITVVDTPHLTSEKSGPFAGIASGSGQQAAEHAKVTYARVRQRMGMPLMVLAIVLLIAWFALPALLVNLGFATRRFSVSELLGIDINQGGAASSFGFWSFLGLVSVLLPWLTPWLRQRWASLLNAAPFVLLNIAFLRLRLQIHALVSQAIDAAGRFGGVQASAMAEQMVDQMSRQLSAAITYGLGLWIVAMISLALAVIGVRSYRRPFTPT